MALAPPPIPMDATADGQRQRLRDLLATWSCTAKNVRGFVDPGRIIPRHATTSWDPDRWPQASLSVWHPGAEIHWNGAGIAGYSMVFAVEGGRKRCFSGAALVLGTARLHFSPEGSQLLGQQLARMVPWPSKLCSEVLRCCLFCRRACFFEVISCDFSFRHVEA